LKEGDKIVTKGSFKIDSSLQIQTKPSMMSSPVDGRIESAPATVQVKKGNPSLQPPPDDILAAYFAVHKALFSENLEDALKNASKLDGRYSTSLGTSKDIKTARENFSHISMQLYKEASEPAARLKKHAYWIFCPMAFENKGAYWLQDSDKVQNPYFGSIMPKCGELQETIPAGKQ